jgi:hypothetical protein
MPAENGPSVALLHTWSRLSRRIFGEGYDCFAVYCWCVQPRQAHLRPSVICVLMVRDPSLRSFAAAPHHAQRRPVWRFSASGCDLPAGQRRVNPVGGLYRRLVCSAAPRRAA